MKRILFWLLFFIGLSFCVPVYAVDLDSLLVRSLGGPAAAERVQSLQSWQVSGRAKFAGHDGAFRRYFARPNRYLMEIRMPQYSLIHAFDGQTAWQTDLNGRVSSLEGYFRDELLNDIYLLSYDFMFSDTLEKMATYLGIKEIDGKVCHELAIVLSGRDTVLSYIDTASGLEHLSISGPSHLSTYTYLEDFRPVSGILFPYHVKSQSPQANINAEFFVDTVIVDGPIDTSVFSPPEEMVSDYRFPPDSQQVTLPVEYKDGHIRIPVTVNGKTKLLMLLDTGASSHVLNQNAVSELNLPEVGLMGAVGLGGAEQVLLVQTDSIQVGSLTLYNQVCGSMDLDGPFESMESGKRFGGLLGQDFWSRFPILVDYYYSKITVFNPETFTPPEGGVEVPFHLSMLVPVIRGEVEGVAGDFVVDIGNASGLLLNKNFVDDNNLEKTLSLSLYAKRAFVGIGGFVTGRNAYTSKFRMGDVELKSLLVFVPDAAVGMMGSDAVAGNIGNRVLEKFRVLFDYHRSRMIFYRY